MTAVERGMELLQVVRSKLPPLALEFRDKLCREVGMCIEVCLTAFAVYANIVEGLPNDDIAYEPRPTDRDWFASLMKGTES